MVSFYSFLVFTLAQISSAEFALVQSVQENANLRSKIIQSPDKLQVFLNSLTLFRKL